MTLEPPALTCKVPPGPPALCCRLGIPHPGQDDLNPNPLLGGLFTSGPASSPRGTTVRFAEGQDIFGT